MAATAVWALWVTTEYVNSMARPTTDDFLTLTVSDDLLDIADPEHTPGIRDWISVYRMLDRRTQHALSTMVLSAC